MMGEKKGSDLSSRLGVRRAKTTSAKGTKPSRSAISTPPKAAIATAKRFNDMLHRPSSRERERVRRVSESAASREEVATVSPDEDTPCEDVLDAAATQRIAELERELTAAREEQNTAKEELTKLKEHALVYRETIEVYRRQLAGAYQLQHPPATFNFNSDSRPTSPRAFSDEGDITARTSLSQPPEDLAAQNDSLRTKVAQLQHQLTAQEATYQSMLNQGKSRDDAQWEELTARLHATEKESQERLQQLFSLKSAFSSLTRVHSQVTDGELSETFIQLSSRVREFVISNYRRAKLDLSNIPPETTEVLELISPTWKSVHAADRLALFQALISTTMMQIFREPIFVGLQDTSPIASLRHLASIMQDAGSDYRNWQHATIRSLQKSEARHGLQEEKKKMMHRLVSDILHHLTTITATSLPPDAHSALESILHATADFQNVLLLQKAQYRVHFFRRQSDSGPVFDEQRMESINELEEYVDEDGDVITERVFAFCVFPCLEKFGDEYGEHIEVSNVLAKARICCSAG